MLEDKLFMEFSRKNSTPGEHVGGEGWMDIVDISCQLPFLYSLVFGFPKVAPRVLEIGVSDGTSSLAFLKGLSHRDNPPRLQSVDISDCQQLAKKAIDYFGLSHLWDFHLMSSDEYFRRFPNEKFDIIFIDGDHSYEGARRDFFNAIQRLNHGGIILIHDSYMHRESGKEGVSKLVYEIILDNYFCCFTTPTPQEMTIIQRKDDVLERMGDWK